VALLETSLGVGHTAATALVAEIDDATERVPWA